MSLRFRRLSSMLLAAAFLIASSSLSVAGTATASHSDVAGATVDFTDINETDVSSTPGAISTLFFGQPSANGDILEFPALGFRSVSTNAEFEFLDGQIKLDITGRDGATFDSIEIRESGFYNLLGADSFVSSAGGGIVKVNGSVVDSQSFNFIQSGTVGLSGITQWSGGVTFNFAETNQASLTFDNQLITSAAPQGLAFIDKKQFDVVVETDEQPVVPEPASAVLVGLAGLGLMTKRRRS